MIISRYDLESLYLGLDDEITEGQSWWSNDYKVPDELLIEKPVEQKRRRRLHGIKSDEFRPNIE